MLDDTTSGTEGIKGQEGIGALEKGASAASSAGKTDGQSQGEQAASPKTDDATGKTGHAENSGDDVFFNPEDIKGKPELEAAYRQMQAAFTKKTQAIRAKQKAAEAYESFMQNPHAGIKAMAEKLGYQLQGRAASTDTHGGDEPPAGSEPKTWDEVYTIAEKRALEKVRQEMAPFLEHITEMKKSSIEKMLDDSAPDWRQYEDDMQENLRKHPTLVTDPLTLYTISVPKNVLESRAAQAAMKKLKEKMNSSEPSGQSTTRKSSVDTQSGKPMSFRESVEYAKQKLAEKGVQPPPGFRF